MNNNKKIGVITHPTIFNYGGILQAYALQTVLKRLGFESEVIEKRLYPKQLTQWEKLYLYPYRYLKKKLLHKKCQVKFEEIQYNKVKFRYEAGKYTMPFVDKYVRHRYIHDYNELKASDYFAIIVGSDQIWKQRTLYLWGMRIENAYLDFAKNWSIKRISYAASFGFSDWDYDEGQTQRCKELLAKFDAVSCREDTGEAFCKSYLNYADACTVLDPTMLLDCNDYLALCSGQHVKNQTGLMCYVLDKDERSERIIELVQKQLGCTSFEVMAKSKSAAAPVEERAWPPVEEWIEGFQNASFIVTDSFHACVFSILFRKPFVAIVNKDRGEARFYSLLDQFGLSDRLINDIDEERLKLIVSQPLCIDQSVLDAKRVYSIDFLKNNLGLDGNCQL